jgi:hypothetical protein
MPSAKSIAISAFKFPFNAAFAALEYAEEQFVQRNFSPSQAVLVRITDQDFERIVDGDPRIFRAVAPPGSGSPRIVRTVRSCNIRRRSAGRFAR